MQKLSEASDRKWGNACAKKRDCPDKRKNLTLSAATSGVSTPCKLEENNMRLSLDDAFATPSTGSSHLFYHQPMAKTPDLD